MARRLIAIGDIHGCAAALDGLLEIIAPGADDRLVFLGDYVDRGPDSRGVIDRVLGLRDTHDVVTLMGNHEEMMLHVVDGRSPIGAWFRCGGRETMASYAPDSGLKDIPDSHIEFLRSLLDYHEEDDFFFLHANYAAGESLDRQPVEASRWMNLMDRLPPPHKNGKTAVVGHSSQKNGEVLDAGHVLCLDTFCIGGGWLTGRDLLSGKTWQVDAQGSPREGR